MLYKTLAFVNATSATCAAMSARVFGIVVAPQVADYPPVKRGVKVHSGAGPTCGVSDAEVLGSATAIGADCTGVDAELLTPANALVRPAAGDHWFHPA